MLAVKAVGSVRSGSGLSLVFYVLQVNRNVWLRLSSNSSRRQPFCQITLKNTPEVAGANGLADALIRLDFISALADMRRFR